MALNGSQVLLLVETAPNTYTAVGEQTGLSMENSMNLIEVSNKSSNHTQFIYGREDNTLSLDALYVPSDAGLQALKNAKVNRQSIVLRRSENGTDVEEATALIQKISTEFPDDDVSTVSIDLQLIEAWHAPGA